MYPEKQEVYFFYFDVHTPQYPDDVLFFYAYEVFTECLCIFMSNKGYEYLWATE